ncbi:hypothetical protein BCU68_12435 [Vibrio sp. 10N.286.49.B3]|uniref:hypothetical protein n=1 Tax=Vibrio sp. 10N.286.49.B3 TaxID=1880855 RepID=UPI000C8260E6|nr:hypothetical protein [Vibrio sp. 10N.286.49.B3]PMH44649.1 hypothetical protein BCU68_12435 [Vibrio sp. 10N.286.49.B3]
MMKASPSVARDFCNELWGSYCNKYPEFVDYIDPVFVHLAIYQSLLSHSSVPESASRAVQQELINSFEQWYKHIDTAYDITWIELDNEVIDAIQFETGDYGYAWDEVGSYIGSYQPANSAGNHIRHQLFQMRPAIKAIIEESNHNLEIVRRIRKEMLTFYPLPILPTVPGEKALFKLMTEEVSRLLIGSPQNTNKACDLATYLYIFQGSTFRISRSIDECALLAFSIENMVKEIQSQGSVPTPIDSFWKMALGYSDEFVTSYNELMLWLDGKLCTVSKKDIPEGVEVSVWCYPMKEQTTRKVIIKSQGDFKLAGDGGQANFKDAQYIAQYLMGSLNRCKMSTFFDKQNIECNVQ